MGLGPFRRDDSVAEADLLGEVVQGLRLLPAMGDAELLDSTPRPGGRRPGTSTPDRGPRRRANSASA